MSDKNKLYNKKTDIEKELDWIMKIVDKNK